MIKINIKATGISLTPSISEYIDKKVGMLEKFYRDDEQITVNVEVGRTTKHHKSGDIFRAEIHMRSRGNEYYATAERDDLYAAIDEVKDQIVRELTSKRGKIASRMRREGIRVKNLIKGIYKR